MFKTTFTLLFITFYVSGCMVYIPGPNGSAGHYVDVGTTEQVKENLSDFGTAAGEVTKVAVESGALDRGTKEYHPLKRHQQADKVRSDRAYAELMRSTQRSAQTNQDPTAIAASSSLGVKVSSNTGNTSQQGVQTVSNRNTVVTYEAVKTSYTEVDTETTEGPEQREEPKRKGEAYCWKWSGSYDKRVYYKCYGPVQLLSTGYEELEEAILLSGCHGSEWKSSNDRLAQEGFDGGSWLVCHDTYLKPYDNSPDKISDWVNRQ